MLTKWSKLLEEELYEPCSAYITKTRRMQNQRVMNKMFIVIERGGRYSI